MAQVDEMLTATLDEEGRLSLPEEVRRRYGWGPGTVFLVRRDANGVFLEVQRAPGDVDREQEDKAQVRASLAALVEEMRAGVPADLTDEEIDQLCEEVIGESRRERRADRR